MPTLLGLWFTTAFEYNLSQGLQYYTMYNTNINKSLVVKYYYLASLLRLIINFSINLLTLHIYLLI